MNQETLPRQKIGGFLRTRREQLGRTLDGVVSYINCSGGKMSPSSLSRVERGASLLTFEDASILAETLGFSVLALEEIVRTARFLEKQFPAGSPSELNEQGEKIFFRGQMAASLDYFDAAEIALRKAGTPPGAELAEILFSQAMIHARLSNFVLAREINKRARKIKGLGVDEILKCHAVEVMLGYAARDFIEAALHARAMEPMLDLASPRVRAFSLTVLGSLALETKKLKEAIPPLEKALRLNEQIGRKDEALRLRIILGAAYAQGGEWEKGISTMEEATYLAEKEGLKEIENFGHLRLARAFFENNQLESAQERARLAWRRSNYLNYPLAQFRAVYVLWKIAGKKEGSTEEQAMKKELVSLLPCVDSDDPDVRDFLRTQEAEKEGGMS